MSVDLKERSPDTVDLAAAAELPAAQREVGRDPEALLMANQASDAKKESEQLAPLFVQNVVKDFRSRWDAVQSSFVDDPKQAVRQGDELVAEVMKSLAETFANDRAKLEGQLDQTDKPSTENLRVALRRYHSFFDRLLSL